YVKSTLPALMDADEVRAAADDLGSGGSTPMGRRRGSGGSGSDAAGVVAIAASIRSAIADAGEAPKGLGGYASGLKSLGSAAGRMTSAGDGGLAGLADQVQQSAASARGRLSNDLGSSAESFSAGLERNNAAVRKAAGR
ncbi:MAG: hypothetical protein HY876_08175, partial [Coriobacteriales bacterium]|nr:hypothetical protein [Coriobacteriales bacterium]